MTTPSKAALRAAEAINAGYGIAYYAEIIDRETGLPELVACLREARESLADLGRYTERAWGEAARNENRMEIDRIHARIDAALARVDSPEPVR